MNREIQGSRFRSKVPAKGNNISSLIHTLEHGKEDLGVEFYNVGKATLDEIFEKIVQQHEDQSQRV